MTFERKLVEQSFLPVLTFPHHRQHSNPPDRIESPPPCPDNFRVFQHNRPKADPRPGFCNRLFMPLSGPREDPKVEGKKTPAPFAAPISTGCIWDSILEVVDHTFVHIQ